MQKYIKRPEIDRRHFSKIRCDVNYKPKKSTAIALCIALELNLKENRIASAGRILPNCDIGDLVIKFFIERKIYDLTIVNEALDLWTEDGGCSWVNNKKHRIYVYIFPFYVNIFS